MVMSSLNNLITLLYLFIAVFYEIVFLFTDNQLHFIIFQHKLQVVVIDTQFEAHNLKYHSSVSQLTLLLVLK